MTFRGNGSNIIYIDWDNDIVAVIRWIRGGPALNDVIGKILAAVNPSSPSSDSALYGDFRMRTYPG